MYNLKNEKKYQRKLSWLLLLFFKTPNSLIREFYEYKGNNKMKKLIVIFR